MKKTESISNQISTLKSCVGVALVGAALAGGFLLIRLVGEERLQRFLEIFLFKNKKLDMPHPIEQTPYNTPSRRSGTAGSFIRTS